MMLTNLYLSPLRNVTLTAGWNTLTRCSPLTAGESYYFRSWLKCSGGTAKITVGGLSRTISADQQIKMEYKPSGTQPQIYMEILDGTPSVSACDICICKDYAATVEAFTKLGIPDRFNGNTMPLA